MAEPEPNPRITGVKQGRARADLGGAEILVETTEGERVLDIDRDALIALGGICLHAATQAPLGDTLAIPVVGFTHQSQRDGTQMIGLQTPAGHMLSFALRGDALKALMQFLLKARDANPPP
jgi:hypothetical protein